MSPPPSVDMNTLRQSVRAVDKRLCVVDTEWTDNTRGVNANGHVTSWGANITDMQLVLKDKMVKAPSVRTPMTEEIIGVGDANKFWLQADGEEMTFQHLYTQKLTEMVKKRGVKSFTDTTVQNKTKMWLLARHSYAIVPLDEKGEAQMAPACYSYQTVDPNNPKWMALICTPTGTSIRFPGTGYTDMLMREEKDGVLPDSERWLLMKETDHVIGAPQSSVGKEHGARDAPKKLGMEGDGGVCGRIVVFLIPLLDQPPPAREPYFAANELKTLRSLADVEEDNSEVFMGRSLGVSGDGQIQYMSLCDDADGPSYRGMPGRMRVASIEEGSAADQPIQKYQGHCTRDPTQPIVCSVLDFATVQPKANGVAEVSEDYASMISKHIWTQYKLYERYAPISHIPAMLTSMDYAIAHPKLPKHMSQLSVQAATPVSQITAMPLPTAPTAPTAPTTTSMFAQKPAPCASNLPPAFNPTPQAAAVFKQDDIVVMLPSEAMRMKKKGMIKKKLKKLNELYREKCICKDQYDLRSNALIEQLIDNDDM